MFSAIRCFRMWPVMTHVVQSYGCGCYFARDAALAERYLRGGNEVRTHAV